MAMLAGVGLRCLGLANVRYPNFFDRGVILKSQKLHGIVYEKGTKWDQLGIHPGKCEKCINPFSRLGPFFSKPDSSQNGSRMRVLLRGV
jgi:hypothetical protein